LILAPVGLSLSWVSQLFPKPIPSLDTTDSTV
jgi:hypothetical protein